MCKIRLTLELISTDKAGEVLLKNPNDLKLLIQELLFEFIQLQTYENRFLNENAMAEPLHIEIPKDFSYAYQNHLRGLASGNDFNLGVSTKVREDGTCDHCLNDVNNIPENYEADSLYIDENQRSKEQMKECFNFLPHTSERPHFNLFSEELFSVPEHVRVNKTYDRVKSKCQVSLLKNL